MPRRYNIETIYQTLALADNIDAPGNMFLGRELTTRLGSLDDSSMEDETRKVMKRLNPNFTNFAQPVRSLSGGQRQAIAIARAMHFNAQVLIMDEPTAALGPAETAQVRELVRQLKTEGIGIFLISHDIHDVFDLSDRISVMYHGRIVGDGRQVGGHDRRNPRHDHPRQAARTRSRSRSWPSSSSRLTADSRAHPGRTPVPDDFFTDVPGRIGFGGVGSTDPLSYAVYEPDRLVLGKRMEDHLRLGVCLWHSFAWDGGDMFGIGTLDRPWLDPAADPMPAARQKMAVAFEFIEKLGVPYYCFHDRDVAPEGASFAEFRDNLDALADDALGIPGANRRAAAMGHGQPVHAPPLPGRRLDQPRSRGLRLRRRPGQAHARGHEAPRRQELRPVGRPRGL